MTQRALSDHPAPPLALVERPRAHLAAALAARGVDIAALLTEREIEALGFLADGYAYRSIAQAMAIGVGTVQTHVKNIYRKLGVSSREEVAALAGRRPHLR